MSRRKRYAALAVLATAAVAGGILAGASAGPSEPPVLTDVATANTRSDGYAPASKLSVELRQVVVAQGSTKLDGGSSSPSSVGYYGYDNDVAERGRRAADGADADAPATEAHKTEPDKNTYLVFKNSLTGADPHYYYGTHFLFQGHEGGSPGYITRINLDADAAHRVTLLATKDVDRREPRRRSTARRGIRGPSGCCSRPRTRTRRPTRPRRATRRRSTDVSGALGRGGYEGIQDDSDGNIWIVEDVERRRTSRGTDREDARTASSTATSRRRQGDLANGKLQVLQVLNAAGDPITKASQTPLNSPDQVALHTYGASFKTSWVTIHDTAVDGNAPFQANPLATAAKATPFKRPENAAFRPQDGFKEFYFDETGDTNATSPENAIGGWTGVFKLTAEGPVGRLRHAQPLLQGRRGARRLRQRRRSSRATRSRSSRTPAPRCTSSATPSTRATS